jgi:hypothetical protein
VLTSLSQKVQEEDVDEEEEEDEDEDKDESPPCPQAQRQASFIRPLNDLALAENIHKEKAKERRLARAHEGGL